LLPRKRALGSGWEALPTYSPALRSLLFVRDRIVSAVVLVALLMLIMLLRLLRRMPGQDDASD
jgi:hypothetical protein